MEYERIREKMTLLSEQCYSQELSACSKHPIFQPQKFIDQILSLVEIRADDQSLPEIPRKDIAHIIMERDSVLKKAGFIKVAPKAHSSPLDGTCNMNIPNRCLLIGSGQYKDCDTCALCPEGHSRSSGDKWSELNFHDNWCKDWIEANPAKCLVRRQQ